MKTVDLHRLRLAPEAPVLDLRKATPPSITRIPLVDLCTCRHARESHDHLLHAASCRQCDCGDFVRWEPRGT